MITLIEISAHLDAAAAALDLFAKAPALAVRSSQLRHVRELIRLARSALTPLERDLRAMRTLLEANLAPRPPARDRQGDMIRCPSQPTTPKPYATSEHS